MDEFHLWIVLAAGTLSLVVNVAVLLWCVVFSRPGQFQKSVDALGSSQVTVTSQFSELRNAFLEHRTEMNSVADAVEGMLENVERKRKQTATAASRLAGPQLQPVPQTREEMVAAGRRAINSG